jgi:transcriptional regulator with XRE-family HTH domain
MDPQRVRARRKELGLTRERLAVASGVSFMSVVLWERGQRQPRPAQLAVLAKALRCSVDDLCLPAEDGLTALAQ